MIEATRKLDLENLTILAVDDMKSMRLTIRKMLRHLNIGKHLKFAENGREGLNVLQSSDVDLVILDWRMPLENGGRMLEKIRNDKKLRDLPVIMVSAESERDIVMEAAETEIDGYLLKPLTLNALDNKIRMVVDRVNYPDRSTVLIREARALEEAGDLPGAIRRIKQALALKPSASRLLRQLGLLFRQTGQNEKAENALKKAAKVNLQDATTRTVLGDMYLQRHDLVRAARYYLEVLSLTSRFSENAIQLGELLLKNNHKKLAFDLFSKVISQSRKNMADRQKIVDICLSYDEFEFPKMLLESMIKEFPNKYDMVYKAGEVYVLNGEMQKALELFTHVERHQSSRLDVKLEIAKIYLDTDQVYKADEYLNKVLVKEPDNVEALALRRAI